MNEQHHAPNPGGIGVGMGWKGLVDHLIEGGMLVGLESLSLRTQRGYGLIDVRPDTTHMCTDNKVCTLMTIVTIKFAH
ncbi:hypothetical protein [Zobellella sp. An-6]|uniref:hypothetical protein n=1 Tax=Zobellella sp. An-6 TaxID=3400218 RepID=UPI004042E0E5